MTPHPSTRIILAGTRLHRPTCTRPTTETGTPTWAITHRLPLLALRDAQPATCCRPPQLVVDAARGGAVFRLAALDSTPDHDTCEARA